MNNLRDKYIQAIANANDEATLEDVRLAAVGKKGEVSLAMRELGKMSRRGTSNRGACVKRVERRNQQRAGG